MTTKRKVYDEAFKSKILQRLEKGETVPALAEEHKLNQSMIYSWRKARHTPEKPVLNTRDAIIYLQHAQTAMNNELKQGKVKKLTKSNLLALLALQSLLGE